MTLLTINWYKIFYWVTVADGVKDFFDTSSNLFTWSCVLCLIALVVCAIGTSSCISDNHSKSDKEDEKDEDIRAWKKLRTIFQRAMYTSLVLAIITWTGYVFTPSKKDALIIISGGAVGNFIASDSSAKQIPAEVTMLLREKLRSEIKELKEGSVEQVTDTLAAKTKEELIELLKQKK